MVASRVFHKAVASDAIQFPKPRKLGVLAKAKLPTIILCETRGRIALFGYPNVKLLGMWSWHAKASQIAVFVISKLTFLRSIGTVTIEWPNPLLRGTDATLCISSG
jgi:hypothetical protein